MTNNVQSTQAKKSSDTTTLSQIAPIAMKVLPSRSRTLQHIVNLTEVIDIEFTGFELDSRQLGQSNASDVKSVFVLLKSQTQPLSSSQQYAEVASNKAAFILSEIDPNQFDNAQIQCPIVHLPSIRDVLGTLIQLSLLDKTALDSIHSHQDLAGLLPKVIAVTGTNGKTTISQLVAQLCQLSDKPDLKHSAVMGTAGNGRLDSLVQASHTTGDALAVQRFLHQMADDGVNVLSLEASSHGLDQQRLQGVPVQVAIYTNLSRDHLDYHPDMQDYANAKARLFNKDDFPDLTHAIINADDEFAPLMIKSATESGVTVWTYSLNLDSNADFVAKQVAPSLDGARIELASKFGTVTLDSPLLGRFNVANLLAAVAGTLALGQSNGITLETMPDLVRQLHGAVGRMQRVIPESSNSTSDDKSQQFATFIVDYAHTPDALTQVLTSLKSYCDGQLWAIFGCGGDRDRGKRPLMAQAGLSVADRVVLTSDNPRSEDPVQILEDMQQGMSESQHEKTLVIADRRQAIEQAVADAGPTDIVVIAGKGHETYQEIKGVRYDFDDAVVLQEAFKNNR